MIYSMTAFARAQREELDHCVTVEIKTVNSRYLDIVLRLPKTLLDMEQTVRKQVTQSMRRGRVEVFVQIEASPLDRKLPRLNPTVARFYWGELQDLHRSLPGTDPPTLKHLLTCPNLFECDRETADREVIDPLIISVIDDALGQIHEMRAQEGKALLEDCLGRTKVLDQELSSIEQRKGIVLEEYQQRLRTRVQQLMNNNDQELDEKRLMQEVAFLAERSDITEEVVRIQSHLEQMRTSLLGAELIDGRKLDFLVQELHREVNTIGSKAGDYQISQAVIRMKSEISKLREQIQNIE